MSSMLRSDRMTMCEMYLQPEVAFQSLDAIAKMGFVQFKDMTPHMSAFHRKYTTEIRRLNDLVRILTYIKNEIIKYDIFVPELQTYVEVMPPHELNDYEAKLEKLEQNIQNMELYQIKLMSNLRQLAEQYYVLSHIGPILGDVELRADHMFGPTDAGGDTGYAGTLSVKTGVIKRTKVYAFELMLWRISRGNIFFKTATEDKVFVNPFSGAEVRKVAFVAVCQGEMLSHRVEKVCTGFHATLYSVPITRKLRREVRRQLQVRLQDLEHVLKKTKYHRCKALRTVGRQWNFWNLQVTKARAIYTVMNLFSVDITRGCLIGQCWVPTKELGKVNGVLEHISETAQSCIVSFMSKIETKEVPPTFHRTNKFTFGFQALINAYGDAKYREINPGLFTIITFPFLFAVMFGDLGHAIIMVSFAAWMLVNEKKFMEQKSTNEIWNIFFGGRYIIFLMGLFSMYTGFIYNDVFSRKLSLMPSYWLVAEQNPVKSGGKSGTVELDPRSPSRIPYCYGVDPLWGLAHNVIVFDNSLKMKLSIILGIIHMAFGLSLSLLNHLYFKHKYAIFLEFIPQLVFLCSLFMWLVFLMFYKWFSYSAKLGDVKQRPGCAPLILILFIDMMLMKTSESKEEKCDPYMFACQQKIQKTLLFVGLICIPIMLLGSPIYLHLKHKQEKKDGKLGPDDEWNFGEIMIHQSIHTIEFVLSTISHTASYLRLWALSLAHAQLSEMLWKMVLVKSGLRGLGYAGVIQTYFIFAVWAGFSLSILVLMEGLSAFLHTLRLHWVEFMSKFFIGGGLVFFPFSYDTLAEE